MLYIYSIDLLFNKCLHCGGLPKAYVFTYDNESKWMLECKCGISTLLFDAPEAVSLSAIISIGIAFVAIRQAIRNAKELLAKAEV